MTNVLTTSQQQTVTQAIAPAVSLWADATTNPESERRLDLRRDKQKAVLDFFSFADLSPDQVNAVDVKQWQAELEAQGLAHATVYSKISRVSSFYEWAKAHGHIEHNPVVDARPKAPQAYQNESAQSLGDEEALALLSVVKNRNDLVGKRDYALLLFYFFTGRRRREIIQLTWGDLRINDIITITAPVKGGDYLAYEVEHPEAKVALLDYLDASGRLTTMEPDTPLWVVHDRPGYYTGKTLSSHGFVKNLKRYASRAGLGDIHLHQTRHTFARWVGEDSGSLLEAQDALGHKNLATTKVYLQRVSVKKDKFSRGIAQRLGLNE